MTAHKTNFDFSFVSDALLDLRATEKNYDLVCTKYAISKMRLRKWEEKYAAVLWAAHPQVLPSTKDGLVAKREIETQPLRNKASEVTDKLLELILDKLKKGGNDITLRTLTESFKEVAPYILPKFDKDNNVGPTSVETSYEVFMQKIYSKINNHVKEETRITGVAKKQSGRS